METLLDPEITNLLNGERETLERLHHLLEHVGAEPERIEQLRDIIEHLDELFLVIVVGEFNAGKSSVLNALFGKRIMEEGPTPTTAKVTILRYGEEPMDRQISAYLVERRYPAELLKHLHLVDTPGTNSIIRQHQRITEHFVPRADLVLFVTSFDRPLTESERQFLTYIRETWGKRLVFVLNKADLARSEEELKQVLEHIRSGCRELMHFEPHIFPVSADRALAAKTAEDASEAERLWAESRFEPFERFITETLTGSERLTLKLTGPLDAAARLLDAGGERLEARRKVIRQDEQNLKELTARRMEAKAELQEGYAAFIAEIDNLLLHMERRGVQFLDDSIRIGKIKLLSDSDAFKEAFTRQVIRDTDRQIEARLTDAVDWLLKHALTLWNRTLSDFAKRMDALDDRRVDASRDGFAYNRAEVFDAIMKEAHRRIETHDLRTEARRILENAQSSLDMVRYAGAGAAGLGVLSGVLIAATALDAVGGLGLVTAGVVTGAGLLVLPRQKRRAIREFRRRVEELRADMREALIDQLDRQIAAALDKIEQTIAPYASLVAQERTRLEEATEEHEALRTEVDRLRTNVRTVLGSTDIGT